MFLCKRDALRFESPRRPVIPHLFSIPVASPNPPPFLLRVRAQSGRFASCVVWPLLRAVGSSSRCHRNPSAPTWGLRRLRAGGDQSAMSFRDLRSKATLSLVACGPPERQELRPPGSLAWAPPSLSRPRRPRPRPGPGSALSVVMGSFVSAAGCG